MCFKRAPEPMIRPEGDSVFLASAAILDDNARRKDMFRPPENVYSRNRIAAGGSQFDEDAQESIPKQYMQ